MLDQSSFPLKSQTQGIISLQESGCIAMLLSLDSKQKNCIWIRLYWSPTSISQPFPPSAEKALYIFLLLSWMKREKHCELLRVPFIRNTRQSLPTFVPSWCFALQLLSTPAPNFENGHKISAKPYFWLAKCILLFKAGVLKLSALQRTLPPMVTLPRNIARDSGN